jgi:hypothetical protein
MHRVLVLDTNQSIIIVNATVTLYFNREQQLAHHQAGNTFTEDLYQQSIDRLLDAWNEGGKYVANIEEFARRTIADARTKQRQLANNE